MIWPRTSAQYPRPWKLFPFGLVDVFLLWLLGIFKRDGYQNLCI